MREQSNPWMSESETALLKQCLFSGCRVLEFGCGGSTAFFFENNAMSVTSVESDQAWLDKLKADPLLDFFKMKKRWLPLYADIGPVVGVGFPVNRDKFTQWPNYHHDIWDHIPDLSPDLVLIDGRFRVACYCQVLLHCKNPDMRIFIHDFSNREQYQCILDIGTVESRADTAVVLRPPANPDLELIFDTLEKHFFLPD